MPILNLTSDGLDIAVLAFPHEWSQAFSLTHSLPCSVTRRQSGREGRRPKSEAIRFTAEVRLVLAGDDAQACRQMLATLGDGWVGLPLWVDARTGADWADRLYDAQRLIDLTAGAIVAHDSTLDDEHTYAPLLVGHFEGELPELPADSDQQVSFQFTVLEDSPYTFRVGINGEGEAGEFPATLKPDWVDTLRQQAQHGLEFGGIAEIRERTIEGQEMAFRWAQAARFTLDREGVRALLAFFVASEGLRRSFTTPLWFAPGTASAEAPHTTTCRLATDALTINFLSSDIGSCELGMVQTPWEIEGVEGETPEQPPRVFFYKFTYALPEPQIYRFTNWERELSRTADGTYIPAPMRHRDIRETLDLKDNAVALESFYFDGNPLQLWRPDRIEAPLLLSIYETETWPIDPDAAVLRWTGEVKRPSYIGKRIDAQGLFLRGILDRQLPRILASRKCQVEIFSAPCGLNRAALTQAGTFENATGCVLEIGGESSSPADTYVYGTIEIGSGLTWEQRGIIASEPIDGGQRITVDWPVRQAATGQAVAMVRGCNRDWDTCKGLGNQARFRGIPNLPQVNLSLPTMALPNAPAKK